MSNAGAIVLAAGAATRMGAQKQLLRYRGLTLLEHCVGQALEAQLNPVIVVVGAGAPEVRAAIAAQPVEIVENPAWQSGMGSSLSAGMQRLLNARAAAVAVLLADQPRVLAEHLIAMRQLLETCSALAVAAQYSGGLGVPAFFKRELFAALAGLPPEAGARRLLRQSGLH
ncbi:MAG TPA: nucleotidyltransferase family protein, partial [Bryobacteraceae bacterium]